MLFVINGSAFTQFGNYAITIKLKDKNMSDVDYFCNDSNLREYLNSRDPADMLLSEIPAYTYYTLSLSLVYLYLCPVFYGLLVQLVREEE